ncbi:alpha/beta hydrolase [Altererythrobacter sp. SALINAS58]|nr:alpha/beta hydrolase [Alteripontixanthobacter muriae]
MQQAQPIDRRAIPAHAVEKRWIAADGHSIRRIDWLSRPSEQSSSRGSILFLPGRGDHYEKYLESLEEWHRAGWNATAMDWRGQAGSGRLGIDPVTGHVEDFAVWIDDLAHFWGEWKDNNPAPHVLIGHSMGGHLALRAVAERKIVPHALVMSAPMLGFTDSAAPNGLMHLAARTMARLGHPARPAWKWSEKPGEMPASRERLLTHDADRYADEAWWRKARPELVMGPGSWRWVERAYRSMRDLTAPGLLETISIPMLIVATDNDRLVGWKAIQAAARRLPQSELVRFGAEARHEILREVDEVRNRAMSHIDAFLARVAPAQSGRADEEAA